MALGLVELTDPGRIPNDPAGYRGGWCMVMPMRRVLMWCCLAVITAVSAADAWEFRMRGEYEFRARYFSRTGNQDLFGDARSQQALGAGGFIGFAGPSYYMVGALQPAARSDALRGTVQITRGGFSRRGDKARIGDTKLTLYPAIHVNSAVSVLAALNFGGFRHKFAMSRFDGQFVPYGGGVLRYNLMPGVPPYERYYMFGSSDGGYNTASLLSVDQLKAIVVMPMLTLAVGVKNFPIGTGATYGRNTREESVYMVAPYGPLSFHYYLFVTQPSGERFPPEFLNVIGIPDRWETSGDVDLASLIFQGFFAQYHAANVEIGLGGFFHADSIPGPAALSERSWKQQWTQLLGWMKYHNGRLFFNGEVALEDAELVSRHGPSPLRYDLTGYHSFVETGVVLGAGKLSLMWAQASGRDLGLDDNTRSTSYVVPINYQALEPYNYLMFHTYAGGNNQFNRDGTGEMGDALALAVRGDYAAAANLNIFGSLMWAKRLERQGYFAGAFGTADSYRLAGVPPGTAPKDYGYGTPGNTTGLQAQQWKAANSGSPAAGLNPYVEDGSLGWEAVLGLSWQILEGVTWNARFSRWQPGPWFDQAYKAFTASAPGRDGNGLLIGRDPIIACHVDMGIDF
ncbi:MAG: hypothetical protein AB1646_17600 [Thermodesulfobacteriota bacterium]